MVTIRASTISELAGMMSSDDTFVALSFDIDWACDIVINYTIDILELYGVPATIYVTHKTIALDRIRNNDRFDIGIHPNFNSLINGDSSNGRDAEEVVDKLLEIVPEATTVRSHSLLQSERLVDLFASRNLRTISNFFIPHVDGRAAAPWKLWSGVTAFPHCWQDNVSMKMNAAITAPVIVHGAINVLNFHPIHVFLNSENLERYEAARAYHREPDKLRTMRHNGYGTEDVLRSVIGKIQ